ncbi:hypothetical protein SAMN05192533_12017 [Mesobacillus persicus]|uniref:Uncharacterized protein n=1 Tax=Mesobacillus persicus TaxID=930146 RepID=A0A1H8J6M2_9BACI|nr:hypothetical protein SAMN05192533_12017 [Mesobacillus persicus]
MGIGKQIILALTIYAVSALLIEALLWYFNPSLNEYLKNAITTSPILISVILTRIIVKNFKPKRYD